jgi:hypothetical protein
MRSCRIRRRGRHRAMLPEFEGIDRWVPAGAVEVLGN